MGVYLVTASSPSTSSLCFCRQGAIKEDVSKSGSGLIPWIFQYVRGPILTVKLYFTSVNKFLFINMRTNAAKFIYLDFELDPSIKFYWLQVITSEQEQNLVASILSREFLLGHCFSASLMMNSASPIDNPDLMVKFTSILFPFFKEQSEFRGVQLEYCPSLLLKVICQILLPSHPLQQVNRHRITPTDLLNLCEQYLDAVEVDGTSVFRKERINLGLELIY